jgi:transposase
MNLALTEAEVLAECKARNVIASAIEPLPVTGTHLVCRTIEGADEIRHRLKKHLIEGKVKRFGFYRQPSSW